MRTITVNRFKPIDVPAEVAVCPICGSAIIVEEINEWTDKGIAESISVECISEPDIDGDEWNDWFEGHWRNMPYVYWSPVNNRVLAWLCETFRCVWEYTAQSE